MLKSLFSDEVAVYFHLPGNVDAAIVGGEACFGHVKLQLVASSVFDQFRTKDRAQSRPLRERETVSAEVRSELSIASRPAALSGNPESACR
jgi:hypothetical protein